MSDDELLQMEMTWTRPSGSRGKRVRPPPGVNAITAFGIVYTLLLWLVTLAAIGQSSGPSGSGVVSLGAILTVVVLGVEMLVAQVLAAKTWRLIGPGPRAILRPIGVLGPWPVLFAGAFGTLLTASFAIALFTGELFQKPVPPPTKGTNWFVAPLPAPDRMGVDYSRASTLCSDAGARVSSRADLAGFDPPFEGITGHYAWLERESGTGNAEWQVRRTCEKRACRAEAIQVVSTKPLSSHVVCATGPRGTPSATTTTATAPTPLAATATALPVATSAQPLMTISSGQIARTTVLETPLRPVKRPSDLGAAMKHDLTRVMVPVRDVRLSAPDSNAGAGPIAFELTVDYAPTVDMKPETRARHYWIILAMVGRRATELGLNLKVVTVQTFEGESPVGRTVLGSEQAKGVSSGSVTPAAALEPFRSLLSGP